MKKWLCVLLAGVLLVCMTACGAKPDASDKNNEDGTPKKTGEYNGQIITMSYTVTDVEYPSDMRSIAMQQGYAAFYDYTFKNSTTGTNTYSGDTWNFLDQNGNRVLSEPYMELESFNKNGLAVAQKMDGTYVQLNTKLEETPITEQEYLDFGLDANNSACNQTYPQGEGRYSCLEDGLAIYVEYVDGKAYAGLVDENGTVIIKAYIPIYYSEMVEQLHLSEGVAFVEDAATSRIGMISVVRSSDTAPNASEGNGGTAMTDNTTTTTPTTTTRPTTATPTAPANKTTETTVPKTTQTTNAYTAADLFFPVHNAALKAPAKAAMKEVSLSFDQVQKRVRMQLPETMTVQLVEQGSKTYAAIYRGDVRIGRLVPNFVFPDTVGRETENELDVNGCTVQHFSYTAGKHVAYTYNGFIMPDDSFFYVLEMSADYISASDLVACLQSLQSIQLLERNNRLDSRGKDGLRIAIAGNSFIGYSNVVQQLQRILNANGKNVDVDEHWYPNITITDFAYDAAKLDMLCGGDYDILFINSAYTGEDAGNLHFLEEACIASGTELVLFPAHNESPESTRLAYRNTTVKLAPWHDAILTLLDNGIAESDLIYYDGVRHSKPLAGFCGAVMIYGMLYETAPNAAAIGADYCGVSREVAQRVEELTMECIRPYFE